MFGCILLMFYNSIRHKKMQKCNFFSDLKQICNEIFQYRILLIINLLTPNVNYSGRTAPLTSKVAFYIFIQQI